MGLQDLDHLCQALTTAYRTSYFAPDSTEFAIAKQVYDLAIDDGFTSTEFRARLAKFLRTQKWPNWTPADFFTAERPKVYPYSWVLELIPADQAAVKAYRVPGMDRPMWGYAHEVGDALEEAPQMDPKNHSDAEPPSDPVIPPPPAIEPETVTLLSQTRRVLELEERVAKQSATIADLRQEVMNLEGQRDRAVAAADALQVELDTWRDSFGDPDGEITTTEQAA